MSDKLFRKSLILAKVERTYATDPTPAGTDAMLTSIPEFDYKTDRRERDYVRSSLSPIGFGVGARRATLRFKTELKGANGATAVTPTDLEPLFQACGCTAADNSTTSRQYTPAADPDGEDTSATIYFWIDGIKWEMLGARGTAVLNFDTDGHPWVDWTLTSLYANPTDTENATAAGIQDHVPPACLNVGLTIGSYSPVGVRKVTLDLGMEVGEVQDMQEESGLSKIYIKGRTPKLTIECDADTLANFDPFSLHEDGTLSAISMTVGGTAKNKVKISAPKAMLEEPKVVNVDGRMGYQLSFLLTANTGDDEFKIETL